MADPTPGRHVKASITGLTMDEGFDPKLTLFGTGPEDTNAIMNTEIMNASGACAFGFGYGNPNNAFFRMINAVTGFNYSQEQLILLGMRMFAIRQAFNLREGLTRKDVNISERLKWLAEKSEDGETQKKYMDFDVMVDSLYEAAGWSKDGVPLEGTLYRLGGMEQALKDLYGRPIPENDERSAEKRVDTSAYYTGRRP
jgi:aldehyde:ferredoxin oxidoreductase